VDGDGDGDGLVLLDGEGTNVIVGSGVDDGRGSEGKMDELALLGPNILFVSAAYLQREGG